jgi:energy-coupling factor transporter ATP-binding protein EcfA2
VTERVESECTACGVTDALPRHVYAATGGGEQRSLHVACCAAQGCEICENAPIVTVLLP